MQAYSSTCLSRVGAFRLRVWLSVLEGYAWIQWLTLGKSQILPCARENSFKIYVYPRGYYNRNFTDSSTVSGEVKSFAMFYLYKVENKCNYLQEMQGARANNRKKKLHDS